MWDDKKLLTKLGFSDQAIKQLEEAERRLRAADKAGEALLGKDIYQKAKGSRVMREQHSHTLSQYEQNLAGLARSEKSKKKEKDKFATRWEDVEVRVYSTGRVKFQSNGKNIIKTFAELGFENRLTQQMSTQGIVFIRLLEKKRYPETKQALNPAKKAMQKLRKSLRDATGMGGDPFAVFNKSDGWKPRFQLIDRTKVADDKAKEEALARGNIEYDDNIRVQTDTPEFEWEDDSVQLWIDQNEK